MKLGIVGSGISGLACAYYLNKAHDINVFESAKTIGGHTATVDILLGTRRYAVDTGFIVFNDRNYPNFIKLMTELNVPQKKTTMGFSVSDSQSGLEYSGRNLNTIFAQRRNLFSRSFLTMLKNIIRFNRQATNDLLTEQIDPSDTLSSYLKKNRYSSSFIDQYLIAMGSAIWSADSGHVLDFPANFFISFYYNHGLLNLRDRPQWHVIEGGSREYLAPLVANFEDKIHTNCTVK